MLETLPCAERRKIKERCISDGSKKCDNCRLRYFQPCCGSLLNQRHMNSLAFSVSSQFSFSPLLSWRSSLSSEQNVTALLELGLNVDHISPLLALAGGMFLRSKFPRDYAAISRLLNYNRAVCSGGEKHVV